MNKFNLLIWSGVLFITTTVALVSICSLPTFPAKWYYLHKKCLENLTIKAREEALPVRQNGYLGFSLDAEAKYADIKWIQKSGDIVFFCFYLDPIQSKGIMFSCAPLIESAVRGPQNQICDVKLITKKNDEYWYSFVME